MNQLCFLLFVQLRNAEFLAEVYCGGVVLLMVGFAQVAPRYRDYLRIRAALISFAAAPNFMVSRAVLL